MDLNSMYKIGWEATYGYGDILGAYCYASRVSTEKNEHINLEFWWYKDRSWYPPQNKFHPDDPESVFERLEKIKNFVKIENVKVSHKDLPEYQGNIKDRIRHSKRNHTGFKSTLWKMQKQAEDLGHIAVWTGRTNKEDLRKHSLKHWKIPVTYDEMDEYIREAEKATGKKAIYVDYRMPVDEVFDIIRTSSFCIGNDGIGNVISKNYFKPIIAMTKQPSMTKVNSGPWAFIINPKDKPDIKKCLLFNSIINKQREHIMLYKETFYNV